MRAWSRCANALVWWWCAGRSECRWSWSVYLPALSFSVSRGSLSVGGVSSTSSSAVSANNSSSSNLVCAADCPLQRISPMYSSLINPVVSLQPRWVLSSRSPCFVRSLYPLPHFPHTHTNAVITRAHTCVAVVSRVFSVPPLPFSRGSDA